MATTAFILALAPLSLQAQDGSVRGRVTDMSGTMLRGATVSIEALSVGTLTATNGTFNLGTVAAGTHTIMVQLIGYSDLSQWITVAAD